MKAIRITLFEEKARTMPPEYREEFLADVDSKSGTHYFIADAAYEFRRKKYSPNAKIETQPCIGCGDKTNAAEVRASPELMERMLRGG